MWAASKFCFLNVSPFLKRVDSTLNYSKVSAAMILPWLAPSLAEQGGEGAPHGAVSSGHKCNGYSWSNHRHFHCLDCPLPVSKDCHTSSAIYQDGEQDSLHLLPPQPVMLPTFSLSHHSWMLALLNGTISLGTCQLWHEREGSILDGH